MQNYEQVCTKYTVRVREDYLVSTHACTVLKIPLDLVWQDLVWLTRFHRLMLFTLLLSGFPESETSDFNSTDCVK